MTTTFTYDLNGAALGNLTKVESPGNNAVATRTVEYVYDANDPKIGQPVQVRLVTGAQTAITTDFIYDTWRGLLTRIDLPENRRISYTYNDADQPLQVSGPGAAGDLTGVSSTYAFVGGPATAVQERDSLGAVTRTTTLALDDAGRPTASTVTKGNDTRTTVSLAYDGASRVTGLTDALNHGTDRTDPQGRSVLRWRIVTDGCAGRHGVEGRSPRHGQATVPYESLRRLRACYRHSRVQPCIVR